MVSTGNYISLSTKSTLLSPALSLILMHTQYKLAIARTHGIRNSHRNLSVLHRDLINKIVLHPKSYMTFLSMEVITTLFLMQMNLQFHY